MERTERYRELIRERVRANVWSAGIAAVLMLFYGYSSVVVTSAGGAFEFSVRACHWTMRIGGLAMAGVAILSLLGVASSLPLDVFASGLIGAVFLVGGIVRLLSGETMAILYVLFGALFLREAFRNFAFVQWLRSEGAGAENMPWRDEPPVAPDRSAASELRARMSAPKAADETPQQPVAARPVSKAKEPLPAAEPRPTAPPPPSKTPTPKPEPAAEPPPEGFLAALAKKNDDEQ